MTLRTRTVRRHVRPPLTLPSTGPCRLPLRS